MEPVKVTLDDTEIKKYLTHFTFGEKKDLKVKDQKTCIICLNDYKNGDKVSYLNTCHHLFHTKCINKWLTEFNHKCPMCRKSANPTK